MTLLIEGNITIPISLPGVFVDRDNITTSIVERIHDAHLMVNPAWVRKEVERQLSGSKSSSSPGNMVAAFLRSARLL